jgi:hypothetical protein
MKSSKIQVPSSKEAPKRKLQRFADHWRMELGIYLELGTWNLELHPE